MNTLRKKEETLRDLKKINSATTKNSNQINKFRLDFPIFSADRDKLTTILS